MKQTRNLFFLCAITIFAVASTILSVYNYNPYLSEPKVFLNFYVSLGVSLTGLIGLAIYYLKIKRDKVGSGPSSLVPSLRQAALISLGLVALLVLQGLRILDWLTAISILIIGILIELFFQTKKVHTTK